MSIDIKVKALYIFPAVTVSFVVTGQTILLTVPAGYEFKPFGYGVKAGSDAGATTVTIGRSTALTDFLDTQTLSNLDANGDYVFLMPVPSSTPVKQKVYAAGVVVQVNVTTALGGAINTFYPIGFLEKV